MNKFTYRYTVLVALNAISKKQAQKDYTTCKYVVEKTLSLMTSQEQEEHSLRYKTLTVRK